MLSSQIMKKYQVYCFRWDPSFKEFRTHTQSILRWKGRLDRKKGYALIIPDSRCRCSFATKSKRPSISGFFLSHLNPSPVERGMQGKTLLVNTNIHFDWQSTAARIWNLTLASSLFFGPAFNAMNRILIKGKATEDNQTLETQSRAV